MKASELIKSLLSGDKKLYAPIEIALPNGECVPIEDVVQCDDGVIVIITKER